LRTRSDRDAGKAVIVPTSLTLRRHLDALQLSGARLADLAEKAGLDASVPTCPAWNVRALVAHQAMAHRWATAHVTGGDPDAVRNQTELRTSVADIIGYYREGHSALLTALREAAPETTAQRFLDDAPAPREFWARRQAHETTIHMVDALAAALGRFPSADEADIGTDLAVDGVDELLRGFLTRGRSKLYDGAEYTIAVEPGDADRRWVVHVAERVTVEPGDTPSDVDVTFSGTAAQLYLALWNRGDETAVAGPNAVLERWRATQRIAWS
jgi:uncharacterized protein (TIGR03083 family)